MKKRLVALAAALVLGLALTVPALAANAVTEISVEVTLEQDGSATVVQTWDGSFDEGTECYFPVTNLGEIELSELSVSDGNGVYTTLERWDMGASFEEKAGSCGLNPVDGGYEVCWGITDYGRNRYAVEYRLEGLVASYEDADGFLFQFVPDSMNTGPTDVSVWVQTWDGTPLTEENAGIWGFGFEGQIGFSEGAVLAYTETALTEENSVILMLQLNKGVLAPARADERSFEEVKTRAFSGSDYGEDEGGGMIWLLVIAAGIVGLALLLWLGGKEGRRIGKLAKTADYWREAPIGGNLEASFVLANRFQQVNDEGDLIAAALTRLLAEGCLDPVTVTDAGFLGREQKSVSLRLGKAPANGGLTAKLLYELLVQAAGSDGILQERELEAYCKSNYGAMLQVLQEAQRDGGETLEGIECYKSPLNTDTLAGLTDRGMRLLLQLIGYKKYLLDFSLIAERGVDEALIWRDCLTYAALLGIGDKVMEQLRKHYPADAGSMVPRMETTYYAAYRYHHVTYAAAKSAESEAKRVSGQGGFSSLGGGGGFSGGGSGGGTR